jgi:hypothetical protein
MIERHIQAVFTDDARDEEPAEIRERLKAGFPPAATRRMTTLGLLVGGALAQLAPGEDDAIVYATGYAESRALEDFLDSFPTASPTLFQTSIHPSAVQQLMIGRQWPVREFLPLSGDSLLGFHALRAALLSPSARVLLCGGEERGTWLVEHGLACDRSFAFAASLTVAKGAGAQGHLRLHRAEGTGELSLRDWFELLRAKSPFSGMVAPGWRMEVEWPC